MQSRPKRLFLAFIEKFAPPLFKLIFKSAIKLQAFWANLILRVIPSNKRKEAVEMKQLNTITPNSNKLVAQLPNNQIQSTPVVNLATKDQSTSPTLMNDITSFIGSRFKTPASTPETPTYNINLDDIDLDDLDDIDLGNKESYKRVGPTGDTYEDEEVSVYKLGSK